MASFFIDRPIFAWVIAILIMLAGSISLYLLPVAQYPDIAPPEIFIVVRDNGNSAETMESSVTQIIEQQLNGIDNLNYIYSNSDSTGRMQVSLSFIPGTNVNVAQMQVQNAIQLALPRLPESVQRKGLNLYKANSDWLMFAAFLSDDPTMTREDISDYLVSRVQDPLSRLSGVGEVSIFGAQYAMKIWCDPSKFEQYKLDPSDVIDAIKAQNTQVGAGQLGALPAVAGQEINVSVNAASRLQTVEEFENILLRVNPDGSFILLKDVSRIELAAETVVNLVRINGHQASAIGFRLASGANALETTEGIKAKIEELSQFFPPGLRVIYPHDSTPFIKASIFEVFKTLIEAIILVFLVMLLFLQNFRATLIPTIAIPVVLLGTFGVLSAFGFSINTLTMFGLVLAIGLLVDDAIVVVENVERLMRTEGLSPKEAAKKSMHQISSALVGITLAVSAIFVPMAFFSGSTGVIYRQFAITIVSSMILSLIVALILTPALCATILKPHSNTHVWKFFEAFNRWFAQLTTLYKNGVNKVLHTPKRWLVIYGVCILVSAFLVMQLPTAFLPEEDQGRLSISARLPPGASLERTLEVLDQIEKYFLENENDILRVIQTTAGSGFGITGQNVGTGVVRLIDWSERKSKDKRVPAIQKRAVEALSHISEAQVYVFTPPAVSGLGNASGFVLELIDMAGLGHRTLMDARDQLLEEAIQHPDLYNVRANGLDDVEQMKLDIDLAKAGALSLSADRINDAIGTYWGSTYINDFMDKGRTKRVYMQADAPYRMQADDFNQYYVKNSLGQMVPFSSFISYRYLYDSPRLERFNGQPSIQILGEAVAGKSTGQAMEVMETLAQNLPNGIGYAWSGISFQERQAGSQAPLLYALSLIVIFLCLAALYESWYFPFSVMLAVPLGVIGVFLGTFLRGLNNDIYFQVGLLTIMGLASRNAILIVEFAKSQVEAGHDWIEATLQAVQLRFRPILMTALAFTFGVFPLAISTGVGSGSQNAIGTGIVSGMITATALGIFYTPLFFVLVGRFFTRKRKSASA